MNTLVADRSSRARSGAEEERRLQEPRRAAGGGSTLEQLVSGVWEDLAARALAVCLVCGGDMRLWRGHGLPAACGGCGSELS